MKTIGALGILLLVVVVPPATATIVEVGAPVVGGSWHVPLGENGWWPNASGVNTQYAYDEIRILIATPADTFAPPAMRSFSAAGWQTVDSVSSSTYAVAKGPAIIPAGSWSANLSWEYWFAGAAPPAYLEVEYAVFLGGSRLGGQLLKFNYGNWNGNDCPLSAWNGAAPASVVPAPGAALLVMIGVGLVGWARRRCS